MSGAAFAWIAEVKSSQVIMVAPELGLVVDRGRTFGPCPACGVDKRDATRPACGVTGDGKAWKCHKCDVRGDSVALVSWKVTGRDCDTLDPAGWETVRRWCVEHRLCLDTGAGPAKATPTSRLVEQMMGRRRSNQPPGATASGGRTRSGAVGDAGDPDPVDEPAPDGDGRVSPFAWRDTLPAEAAERLWSEEGAVVRDYLRDGRNLPDQVVQEWGLGCVRVGVDEFLVIPIRDGSGRPVNAKFRVLRSTCPDCHGTKPTKECDHCKRVPKFRLCADKPTPRPKPLYGAHTLSANPQEAVIIVEGELDVVAMAAYGFGRNVVSGIAGAGTWSDEWSDELEMYRHFVLCYDNDDAGNKGVEKLAAALGGHRCSRAILPHKDANDCLVAGVPRDAVVRCIDRAQATSGVELKRVNDYASQLEVLVNTPELLRGLPTSLGRLNTIVGGLRPGLTVITGDSGQGKTTMATWILFDQALKGVPVAITSFEQEPLGTVQKLLRMQSGVDFTTVDREKRMEGLEALGRLPIWVVDHYGHMLPEKVVSTVRFLRRRHGVRAILLDHLGFCVDPEAEDERRAIEAFVRVLSMVGLQEQVWIGLVAHPHNRPAQARGRVTMHDLKGASAIRQDAHDCWVVCREDPTPKRPWPSTRLHVDKSRSEFGKPGSSALFAFDPVACVYAETWGDTPSGQRNLTVPIPKRRGGDDTTGPNTAGNQ